MLAEYGLFFAKVFTLALAIIIVVAVIIAIASKGKAKPKDKLQVKKLNEKYRELAEAIRAKALNKHDLKKIHKERKKSEKEEKKKIGERKRIFVLTFHGDIKASSVKTLREEITGILMVATPQDEVVLRLKSPGGIVYSYGLAASQLQRIRQKQIPLVIIIDEMAASGGYMMAAVGNRILAAPFAVIGSIGVIAQLPNFHRFLQKKHIDFEQIMAGEYKRTLTLFGENTKHGRIKLQEEVNDTQELFKSFIVENRPQVNINQVATGEHWYGSRAIDLKLVDELMTSDDYLLTASQHADLYEICYVIKRPWMNKFSGAMQKGLNAILMFWHGKSKNVIL